ncbi:hypothetical protein HDV05_000528 [Chytridiales sp. JEL 0842]|nr:hypothetical protein HDV05_000528 [Chytridiales sp. JEL 0842]
MDIETVKNLLLGTLQPDQAIRQSAENGLKSIEVLDGTLELVLRVIVDNTLEEGLRKAAGIFFKNRILKGWPIPGEPANDLVGQNDVSFIRQHILQAIIEVPQNVSVFLTNALERILQLDYPKNVWPEFLPDVMAKLESEDPKNLYGALVSLHILVKSFRVLGEEGLQVLTPVINLTFAKLQLIGSKLVASENTDAALLLRITLKTYITAIRVMEKNVTLTDAEQNDVELRERNACVKHKTTWAVLKPNFPMLLEQFIFPQLCFSNDDVQLWEEDPIEYIQRKMQGDNNAEERLNPTIAVEELISNLVRKRGNHTFQHVLSFVNQILLTYNNNPAEQRNSHAKFGALRLTRSISDVIMDKKKSTVHDKMEHFFMAHVFPEFQSRLGYLRAQAFEMLLDFREIDFSEQSQGVIFHSCLAGLKDEDVPVKVHAALCFGLLIEYKAILLQLTSEIDMDTLTHVMEHLALYYSDELTPFAVELCCQMRDSVMRLIQDMSQNSEDDFERNMPLAEAAMGILKTISTLIAAVDSAPQILMELETILAPIIVYILQHDMAELATEILEVVDSLTYCSKEISTVMWEVFPHIISAFNKDTIGFMEDLVASVDNYISHGKQFIIQNPPIMVQIGELVHSIMTSDRFSDEDRTIGCMIAESAILNLRGHIDTYIPHFVFLALQRLKDLENIEVALKLYSIELVVNCIYYNPVLTLQALEKEGATAAFFQLWYSEFAALRRVHDKKLAILALSSILSTPPEALPTFGSNLSSILTGILQVFESYPAAVAAREKIMEDISGAGEDEVEGAQGEAEEEAIESSYEEDGDVSDEEEDLDDFFDDHPDYGAFIEGDLEEDPYFESPLDEINPYIHFAHIISSLPSNHPIRPLITPEQEICIHALIATAAQEQAKLSAVVK